MVGTVGTLTDLCSLLSMYNWPATNITAANTITNVALANCVTSLILLHQMSPTQETRLPSRAALVAAGGMSSVPRY